MYCVIADSRSNAEILMYTHKSMHYKFIWPTKVWLHPTLEALMGQITDNLERALQTGWHIHRIYTITGYQRLSYVSVYNQCNQVSTCINILIIYTSVMARTCSHVGVHGYLFDGFP